MVKRKKNRSGKVAVEARKRKQQGKSIKYKCLECGIEEDIPRSAIDIIDIFDEGLGDPEFECKQCKGIMEAVVKPKISNSDEVIHIIGGKSFPNEDDDDWMF